MDFVIMALKFLEAEVLFREIDLSLKFNGRCARVSVPIGGLGEMTSPTRVIGSGSKVASQWRILFGILISQTATFPLIVCCWKILLVGIIWEMIIDVITH